MDLRIGIAHSSNELHIEADLDEKALHALIDECFAENAQSMVKIEEKKGGTVFLATRSIAYIRVGKETTQRIGFVR